MRSGAAILVPVDFSERAAPAARYAKSLAVQFDSPLILLHALAPLQFELGAPDISGQMIGEIYRNRAQQSADELRTFLADELAGLPVDRITAEGDPASVIVETAHNRAGLIVMPTHGYGRFRRFILGSTTAKVLHDADCPVWTGVHLENAPAASVPIRHVLCAVDLGPLSSKTLCWAASLAVQFDARLTLMHVALGAADAARREIERLQCFVHAEAEPLIETGDPPATICSAAGRIGADVLVIGRGSAAGVFGRLRANAYSIIRQSPCPVVSV
ncbi:MAG: UspA domain protein [Thermomicrobiales bacterium]|jgi:nucleotide-binding universal stress UspA family protein|nr:UspA domain protein [Thermomicrobiales bacterium]